MENKLDVLSEVVVQLARIEERQVGCLSDLTEIKQALSDHEERIRNIELVSGHNSVTVGSIERIGWMAVTAGIGVAATFFQ